MPDSLNLFAEHILRHSERYSFSDLQDAHKFLADGSNIRSRQALRRRRLQRRLQRSIRRLRRSIRSADAPVVAFLLLLLILLGGLAQAVLVPLLQGWGFLR
jgi:hypothetical protein